MVSQSMMKPNAIGGPGPVVKDDQVVAATLLSQNVMDAVG